MGCVRACCDLRSVASCPALTAKGLRHPIEDAGLLLYRPRQDRQLEAWRSSATPTLQTWSQALIHSPGYLAEFYAVLDGAGPAYRNPDELARLSENTHQRSLGEQMVDELNHYLCQVAQEIISTDRNLATADENWFTEIWNALLQRYKELDSQFFDVQPWRQRTTVCVALAGYHRGRSDSQQETQLFFANLGDAMVGIKVDEGWHSTQNTVASISRRVTDERQACVDTMNDSRLWREHFYTHDHTGRLCGDGCRSWLSSEEMRASLANSPLGYTCLGPGCDKIQVHRVPLSRVRGLVVATDGALDRERLIARELEPSALFTSIVETDPACPMQSLEAASKTEATLIYRQF